MDLGTRGEEDLGTRGEVDLGRKGLEERMKCMATAAVSPCPPCHPAPQVQHFTGKSLIRTVLGVAPKATTPDMAIGFFYRPVTVEELLSRSGFDTTWD